jgi:hypothetical protein
MATEPTITQLMSMTDSIFALFSLVLSWVIWKMYQLNQENNKETNTQHTAQIERINAANNKTIADLTATFVGQLNRNNDMAAQDRKDMSEAFNKLSEVFSNALEKRGYIALHGNNQDVPK